MNRIIVMSLLLVLSFSTIFGCASTSNDTADKSQPQGEMRPTGEGGWKNPNI